MHGPLFITDIKSVDHACASAGSETGPDRRLENPKPGMNVEGNRSAAVQPAMLWR
jgi:hypothetical protein